MGKILCATRGGEASVEAQMAAIRRAKASGDELIFVFVVDVEFMAWADYAMHTDLVVEEMERMGEFLMTMAVERAQGEAVPVRYLIRHGNLREELLRVITEEKVSLLVLGRPSKSDNEQSTFAKLSRLEAFAKGIAAETGIEVWIPPTEGEHG
jgi:nucleotide-binding universal stress UspA family protein